MYWELLGSIIMLIAGIIILGIAKNNFKLKLIGVLMICIGIVLFILIRNPTDNYTEWKKTAEKTAILEIENGQYLIETQNEYIYKAVTYSYSGEKIPEYLEIKKDKNISVEMTENNWSDEAYMVIFTKYAKNAFGNVLNYSDTTQTKYTFYIP